MKPRYLELTGQLLEEIASGAYPVGTSLPGELDLADKYGVSRGTVRAALDQIQTLGLISRRKRVGTRVESLTPRPPEYAPSISTIDELMQYSANTERAIHSVRHLVVDIEMAQYLGCEPGTRWMEIQAGRFDAARPDRAVTWYYVYVRSADGEKIRRKLRRSQQLICDLVCEVNNGYVQEIRQTVRAVGVPESLAERLAAEPGAHALQFVRQYYDQTGALIEVSVSLQPADRFAYTTVLHRRPQG
ncbi:GntR family transcriptional regulator [Cupriavidus plantarum]|uniref:GntR family transcriptional regulator n=1 Tax=Cupriavidus plantarum TaxID=942865 RepID=A0A316EKN6_9BURK|nr:GntR family transcriptional regulator [Cupriavidus plantarum]NYI02394.1 DNA-binding GntR family transcriptional regulator [Cupriavidus plantarum]PWK31599.1 GntR family transcriptional regulator [Cupriavidus plantarum]REE85460.1 GntR family transcriptional regulator [Cupriavidus plantarum]RLK28752.1 GntR family transcriptional regulator [Cupriavidus plantarum]CAG2145813.1 hypothetical protein LMG26296_03820 [Cupriavidus plantarum]